MSEDQPGQSTQFSFPLFLTWRNKNLAGFIVFATACVLYTIVNHNPIFTPEYLPMSWIDHAVPFVPNTLWIYVSEYFFFLAVWLTARDLENLNKYLYSFFALWFFSVLIFVFWPTTYPRDQFPLPEELNALTYWAFSTLRSADAPTNCCPSLHVSSCYLSAFLFLDEQKSKFLFFFLWATAVAISTLTTKQHYFIDVAAGFAMAVIMYWFFHRQVTYRRIVSGLHAKR